MRQKCIDAIKSEQENINKEFPKYENLTDSIFTEITDFANEDFDGISDNKRYRSFLDLCRNILTTAFEQDAQKSYLIMVFKTLKNEDISKYFSYVMQSRSNDIKFVLDRITSEFVYWQSSYRKELKLNDLMKLVDGWIGTAK